MRKLLMLAAVLVAVAFTGATATTAVASWEVQDPSTSEPCSDDVAVYGSVVYGGCLVEVFEGSFDIDNRPHAYNTTYPTSFDVRVGPSGAGYAYNLDIEQPPNGPYYHPCEVDGVQQPWQITYSGIHPVTGNWVMIVKMHLVYSSLEYCSAPFTVMLDGGSSMGPGGIDLVQVANTYTPPSLKNAAWQATGNIGAEWVDIP